MHNLLAAGKHWMVSLTEGVTTMLYSRYMYLIYAKTTAAPSYILLLKVDL
jgi:hypothetical protein